MATIRGKRAEPTMPAPTVLPVNFFQDCGDAGLLWHARADAALRGLDPAGNGSGVMRVHEAIAALARHLDRRNARKMVEALIANRDGAAPLFVDCYSSTKHDRIEIRLRSSGTVLGTLGHLASRTHVGFDANKLLTRKWKREIHLGVASARGEKPTSPSVHAERSGVSPSTQCRAERDARIVPAKQARRFDPDDPKAPDLGRPGVFARTDGVILERLPNVLVVGRPVTRRRLPVCDTRAQAVGGWRYHERLASRARGPWSGPGERTREWYCGTDKLVRGGYLAGFGTWTGERGEVQS